MKKRSLNAFVNIILIILILSLGFSGITLGHILPGVSSIQDNKELLNNTYFMGMTRDGWAEIHDNLGEVILILIIVHLILHLAYIKKLPRLIRG